MFKRKKNRENTEHDDFKSDFLNLILFLFFTLTVSNFFFCIQFKAALLTLFNLSQMKFSFFNDKLQYTERKQKGAPDCLFYNFLFQQHQIKISQFTWYVTTAQKKNVTCFFVLHFQFRIAFIAKINAIHFVSFFNFFFFF